MRPRGRAGFGLALAAAMISSLGCGRETPRAAPAGELEIVDVSRAPDAALSTAEDRRETRTVSAMAGALPDGFPGELVLPRPSSLVDFAAQADGTDLATFDTPQPRSSVAATIGSGLRAAGYRAAGEGVFTRSDRRIVLFSSAVPSGTRFSIRYSRAVAPVQ